MTRLPVVSGRSLIKALEALGYQHRRTRGSHVRLTSSGRRSLTIPLHNEIDRGTLRSILRDAGITVDELLKALQ